jgi:putative endonuclease
MSRTVELGPSPKFVSRFARTKLSTLPQGEGWKSHRCYPGPAAAPESRLFFFVYILGTEGPRSRRTYVGWTTDLARRLEQHNSGAGAKSTRGMRWQLLYAERHATRHDAMSREWHLKRDRVLRKSLRQS